MSMKTPPTEQDYKRLGDRLLLAENFRKIPINAWPDEFRLKYNNVDALIANVMFISTDSFLREHTSVRFNYVLSHEQKGGNYIIAGDSMVGLDLELTLLCVPPLGRYEIRMWYRDSIELLAAAPEYEKGTRKPIVNCGELRHKADSPGFVQLVRELVALDNMG